MRPFPSLERLRTCISISTDELDMSRSVTMFFCNKGVLGCATFLYCCIKLNSSLNIEMDVERIIMVLSFLTSQNVLFI
jgi:hypothetical protein